MKKSIRLRLFLGISGLILFFVTFSLLLNSQCLKSYYFWQKKKSLQQVSQSIKRMYNGKPDQLYWDLEKYERNRGIQAVILDKNYMFKYDSQPRIFQNNQPVQPDPNPRSRVPVDQIMRNMKQLKTGQPILIITRDMRLDTDVMELVQRLNNGDILILNTPVAAINESAAIANQFLFLTGILTILIGAALAFFFAKRFTRPILELKDIARSMAKLDFSKKYKGDSGDEINELGNSINSLSDQLDKSINELKETNYKLCQDIERERKIDRMRKEFVSNVSHELKTPISLIQGYAEGLQVNIVDSEENKNYYCDVIIDEAKKMNKLVRELLDLSQIESGYFKIERHDFNISRLVEEVLEKYEPICRNKNIQCQLEANPVINVNADMVRIEQVLVNYLNNAINHVDENRTVTISIKESPDDMDKVRVSVFNTGRPIPEESIDQIWLSFYKVDKARTRAYGGSGLGLSIVKAIQELHQNQYGVINRDDGVEFWFELDRVNEV